MRQDNKSDKAAVVVAKQSSKKPATQPTRENAPSMIRPAQNPDGEIRCTVLMTRPAHRSDRINFGSWASHRRNRDRGPE